MITVAIVGRPNVGKSTLFNRLIGKRQAIVDDQPGVTRDRLYGKLTWNGKELRIIDTGGYLTGETDRLSRAIVENAEAGMHEADVVVMLVDSRDGVTAADKDLADLLRLQIKPVILAVNKIDHVSYESHIYPFHELGMEPVIGISAVHGALVGDLLDLILQKAPLKASDEDQPAQEISITILGRPNVGKSTLLNRLAGKERSLVDPRPGTTRDPVDTVVKREGKNYRFVDTAGIRASGKIGSDVERYGIMRAKKTLERSDIALLLIDAQDGPTESDARVFALSDQAGRSSIILVNKWDTVEKETGTAEEFELDIREKLSFLSYAPVLFLSALSGQRVHRVYELIDQVYAASKQRLPSSQLQNLLDEIKNRKPPPSPKGQPINLFYWAQTGIAPIQISLYANRPKDLPDNYRKYLINQLYDRFDLTGSPLQLYVKKSSKKE